MSEPDYHATFWHFLDADERYAAETAIARYLADGWQLHGGPIALPGERVLQALVKPAAAERDAMLAAVQAIANVAQTMAVVRARQAGEDAKP